MKGAIKLVTEARFLLNQRRAQSACARLFDALDAVQDPEIPVLSIWQLGVLQDVYWQDASEHTAVVAITPTYSGCPAMLMIADQIVVTLKDAGVPEVEVRTQLSPAWTTEWLDADARQALNDYGVAAPDQLVCPQCGSLEVELISEFSSTACKSLHRCRACLEPFDQFKKL